MSAEQLVIVLSVVCAFLSGAVTVLAAQGIAQDRRLESARRGERR